MQNARYGQIVCFLGIFFLANCQSPKPENTILGLDVVTLEGSNGWVFVIYADGSGNLYHQSLKHDRINWPAATFSFNSVRLLPPFEPPVQDRYPFRWTYVCNNQLEERQYSLPDTAWGASWFNKAYRALLEKNGQDRVQKKLQKKWKESPPPGVNSKLIQSHQETLTRNKESGSL